MAFPLTKVGAMELVGLIRQGQNCTIAQAITLLEYVKRLEKWALSPDEPVAGNAYVPVLAHSASRMLAHLQDHRDLGNIGRAQHVELCALTEELSNLLGGKNA